MKRPAISITNLTKEQLEELIPKSNTLHEDNILNTVYLNIHLNVSITGLLMNSFITSFINLMKMLIIFLKSNHIAIHPCNLFLNVVFHLFSSLILKW